ncbi:MAG: DUF1697 domain-containing protein [Planctomycetota bacterium]
MMAARAKLKASRSKPGGIYVALLRGINVGGKNKLPMADLSAIFVKVGCADVRTYIQSGNVVFRAKSANVSKLAGKIEDGIEEQFGFRPQVVVRSEAELRKVIEENPFASRDLPPNQLLVLFFAGEASKQAIADALLVNKGLEEIQATGQELYVYFPDGIGKSKLSIPAMERALKVSTTGRNWNTVTKLLEIAEEMTDG